MVLLWQGLKIRYDAGSIIGVTMKNQQLAEGSFYQHGWQSWNVTAWRPPQTPLRYPSVTAHRLQSTDPAHLDDKFPGGATLGALANPDGSIELKGALALDAWVSHTPNGLIGAGNSHWFERIGPENEVFTAYAAALKSTFGARTGSPGNVWCSWYSFYNNVNETAIHQVLDGIEGLPFDIVQLDDGWQQRNGDWHANKDFALGLTDLAHRIKATGRIAGLWLAPFIIDPDSETYRKYPDMVLRDASGEPVIAAYNWGPNYTLDVTRPDAQQWLASEMSRITDQGFHYLKLDFLYSAALPGQYHVETGREQAYREASQVIREAVGEDVYLLACGAPIVPSIGIYDGLRVGPDVSEIWDNADRTRHLADRAGPGGADAITTTLGRYWIRELIDIDPDIAFFRSRFCMLNGEQKQMIADLANICGFKANSDLPQWLLPNERERLSQFLAHTPKVSQLDRYRFSIDDRQVDFEPIVSSRPW